VLRGATINNKHFILISGFVIAASAAVFLFQNYHNNELLRNNADDKAQSVSQYGHQKHANQSAGDKEPGKLNSEIAQASKSPRIKSNAIDSYADFQPYEIYERYLQDAKRGDTKSQYIVSRMLEECAGTVKSESRFQELREEGVIAEASIKRMEQQHQKCKPFYAEHNDMTTEAEIWLESAANEESSLAKLRIASQLAPEEVPRSEFKPMMIAALKESQGNQILETDALFFIVSFFSRYDEWRDSERSAWTVVYCRRNFNCDEDMLIEKELSLAYKAPQLEEIVSVADEYALALEEGRWGDLDLDHP
jgi:hypothetical protein